MSTKRHSKRTDEEWLNLIQECRSSGLSDRVWCAEHHIHTSNFCYHIRRLRKLACEIPKSSSVSVSPKQEVVRLAFDEPAGRKKQGLLVLCKTEKLKKLFFLPFQDLMYLFTKQTAERNRIVYRCRQFPGSGG